MEHTESNRVIAEFMKAEYKKDDYGDFGYWFPDVPAVSEWQTGFKIEAIKYHTSWDWLMPVVQKANDYLGINFKYRKLVLEIKRAVANVQIARAHQAVYQFILWHNKKEV